MARRGWSLLEQPASSRPKRPADDEIRELAAFAPADHSSASTWASALHEAIHRQSADPRTPREQREKLDALLKASHEFLDAFGALDRVAFRSRVNEREERLVRPFDAQTANLIGERAYSIGFSDSLELTAFVPNVLDRVRQLRAAIAEATSMPDATPSRGGRGRDGARVIAKRRIAWLFATMWRAHFTALPPVGPESRAVRGLEWCFKCAGLIADSDGAGAQKQLRNAVATFRSLYMP